MATNYKGLLQEYDPSIKPVYNTTRVGGADHEPLWVTELSYQNRHVETNVPMKSKKESEQLAAKILYTYLTKNTTHHSVEVPNTELPPPNGRYQVFIDLENIQPDFTRIDTRDHIVYNMFMSSFSTIDRAKYESYGPVYVIDSAVKDAADHLMSFTAGVMVTTLDSDTSIIIVSRDQASQALTTIFKKYEYQTHHFKSKKELEKYLGK